jgi:putative nucleotidyltransferase with HDIG domain
VLDDLGRLDPESTLPPYRQIAARLYLAVRDAEAGTKLPSGQQLADHFGVARMTTQAAVAELARDGLVAGRQGSGVFVTGQAGGYLAVATAIRAQLDGAEETILDPDVIAEQQQVSVTTARRAIDLLAAEGLPRADGSAVAPVAWAGLVLDSAVSAVRAAEAAVLHTPASVQPAAMGRQVAALSRSVERITRHLTKVPPLPPAADLARRHLAEALPRRWKHVQAVASQAARLAEHLDEPDAGVLVHAAWLHDVGYAPPLAQSGFHPLDGARFLREVGVEERVVALVAHHSAAATEATELELAEELSEFLDEQTLVRDLLWWCDMTTGPDGKIMPFDDRMAEVRTRYGPGHYVTRALRTGMPLRAAAVGRAEVWIAQHDIPGL